MSPLVGETIHLTNTMNFRTTLIDADGSRVVCSDEFGRLYLLALVYGEDSRVSKIESVSLGEVHALRRSWQSFKFAYALHLDVVCRSPLLQH